MRFFWFLSRVETGGGVKAIRPSSGGENGSWAVLAAPNNPSSLTRDGVRA